MAVTSRQESVTNAAEVLHTPGVGANYADPDVVTVANRHATETLYVGGPSVSATTGFRILAGEAHTFHLAQGDLLYGFCAAANASVDVISQGA